MRVSYILLIIIFISFMFQAAIPQYTEMFYLNPLDLQFFQLITSIFLHGGAMHLLFNSYALFAFGPVLESRIGRNNFLALFFGAGIAGNLLYYFTIVLGIIPPIPALGASGAIFGIFGGLVITDPNMRLLIFGIIPMKIRDMAILFFVLEFFGTFNSASGIASAAHLGGLVVGYLAVKFYFKPKMQHDMYSWRQYQRKY